MTRHSRFLPLKNKCTPLEALNILGRADCLRAIHFLHEAQYLCTWVASVCRSHRDQEQENLPWNSRWMVIGVILYMVSGTIDETGESLSQDDSDAGALRKWEDNAKQEVSHGEVDALALVKSNPAYIPHPREETDSNASDEEENMLVEDEGPDNDGPLPLPFLGDGMNHQFDDHHELEGPENEGPLPLPFLGDQCDDDHHNELDQMPLPSLGNQGQMNGIAHQSGHHKELNVSNAEQLIMPFLGNPGAMNGTTHQSGHHNDLNGLNGEQQFFEHPLMVPEILGVQNMGQGDDYDPFGGVEEGGI